MLKTGYVGAVGSHSYVAMKALKPVYEECAYPDIQSLLDAFIKEEVVEIVAPVRNNLTGVYEDVYKCLDSVKYFIKGEEKLRLDGVMCFKNKNKELKDIKKIVTDKFLYEHCKNKLQLHFPNIEVEIIGDCSTAARGLSKGIYSTDIAVLCTEKLCERYKLFPYRKYMIDQKYTFIIYQLLRSQL